MVYVILYFVGLIVNAIFLGAVSPKDSMRNAKCSLIWPLFWIIVLALAVGHVTEKIVTKIKEK